MRVMRWMFATLLLLSVAVWAGDTGTDPAHKYVWIYGDIEDTANAPIFGI